MPPVVLPRDEIIVFGRRFRLPGLPPGSLSGAVSQRAARERLRELAQERAGNFAGLPALALPLATPPPPPPVTVPRPVLTLVPKPAPAIPEIVVTASRLPAMSAAFAGILGALGSLIARDLSQQALDESFREFAAPDAFRPGDTPVIVQQEEVIPEIVVTASRAQQLRAALAIPPVPTFVPFEPSPLELPLPEPLTVPVPDPVFIPETAPVPAPAPVGLPQTAPLPFANPLLNPLTNPLQSPQPFGFPRRVPRRKQPRRLTRPQRRGVFSFSPNAVVQTDPQANPEQARRRCKKCKEDKPRKRCYRKMVKERTMPKNDKVFRWAEIDCKSGREL